MISVNEALAALFAQVTPLPAEAVDLSRAAGRALAVDVVAAHDQPPFAASAMDGYALREADARPGAVLDLAGHVAAGHPGDAPVAPGTAVRILTGAPLPPGADRVIMQEDVTRDGGRITLNLVGPNSHVRARGCDFARGARLAAPRRLRPADVALIAAMNHARVRVARLPDVAILSTGDELVVPGSPLGPGQIVASNAFGLAAMLAAEGIRARILPIAADTMAAHHQGLALAGAADLIVTIGGASVGDHDLVAKAAGEAGFDLAFHKVAMRPGKPVMAGRRGGQLMLGLPGNPVSAMVCATVFMIPLVRALQGLPPGPAPRETHPLAAPLPPNGPREHYLRARLDPDGVRGFARQDSSLLTVLAEADVLIVQPPGHDGGAAGDPIEVIRLQGA
ncbi:MAG: molybdopterin molybdotransferase MoeA [Rubellimicrobium sp.]|nr:molybdopterin molybdotransferase MoeA [Rubellimicrobium sp.]